MDDITLYKVYHISSRDVENDFCLRPFRTLEKKIEIKFTKTNLILNSFSDHKHQGGIKGIKEKK